MNNKEWDRERERERERELKLKMIDAVPFTSCTMNHCFCMFMRNWKSVFCIQNFLNWSFVYLKITDLQKKVWITFLPPFLVVYERQLKKIERWVCIYNTISVCNTKNVKLSFKDKAPLFCTLVLMYQNCRIFQNNISPHNLGFEIMQPIHFF